MKPPWYKEDTRTSALPPIHHTPKHFLPWPSSFAKSWGWPGVLSVVTYKPGPGHCVFNSRACPSPHHPPRKATLTVSHALHEVLEGLGKLGWLQEEKGQCGQSSEVSLLKGYVELCPQSPLLKSWAREGRPPRADWTGNKRKGKTMG